MQTANLIQSESILEAAIRPLGLALGLMLVLLLIRHVLIRALERAIGRRAGQLASLMLEPFRTPTILWCIALGMMAGLNVATLPRPVAQWGTAALASLVILSISIVVANGLAELVQHFGRRMQVETVVTGLGMALTRALVFILGGLLILGTFGVPISPLLAALGIGGLAVSLAMQDTLSNLFAGVHILAEKPIRVGDYIKLETGQEGRVVDVGWRTTRMWMLSHSTLVVPNAKLAQSILINYSFPESRLAVSIPITMGPAADPERVETMLLDEARQAARDVPGLLDDPSPRVSFGFSEGSLTFTLHVEVRGFVDQVPVQDELRRRIFRRLRREGILAASKP